MLKNNNQAVIGLPIYLTIAIIVATMIIGILVYGIFVGMQNAQAHLVEKQIDEILTEAEQMYEQADFGSLRTISVDFPTSMRFVVFGSPPIDGNKRPNNYINDEKTSNNYYFVMDDGNIYTGKSNAKFSGEDTKNFALFGAGQHNLRIELYKEKGEPTYVKIYT